MGRGTNLQGEQRQLKNIRPLLTVIIVLLLVIIWLLIKPPMPLLPKVPKHPKKPLTGGAHRQRIITGIVTAYKNNPHLDINSLELKTKKVGTITIDFRPHTAARVTKIGAIGESVTATYALNPSDETVGYQLLAIKNEKTGVNALITAVPPAPDVPADQPVQFGIEKPTVITDQYGGIVALKKGNRLFHFKPGLVDDIVHLIKGSDSFQLLAVRRRDDQGFININHDKVYIVLRITIDNKTFLVR